MKFQNENRIQPVIQREMPFFMQLGPTKYASQDVVNSFASYREAVMWCWENRAMKDRNGLNDPDDQAMFARNSGMHAPHMSRCVSRKTKAPMELRPDLIGVFENYTGWRAVTQYLARQANVTLMEEVIEQRRAA